MPQKYKNKHNQMQITKKFPEILKSLCLTDSISFLSHKETKQKFFKISQGNKQKQLTIYPKQYPTNLTDSEPIISRERPVRRKTEKYAIPDEKMMEDQQIVPKNHKQDQSESGMNKESKGETKGKWKSPQNSYALNVGLIGPVNAGKSELFGALAHRISAISAKASTTTQIIQGIKTFQRDSEDGIKNIQIKYFDTPGLMYKKQGFISKGWKVLSQIDFSLLVVDSAKRFDDMIKQSIKRLQKHKQYPNFMKALVLNKIDLVDNRRKFDQLITQIQKYGKFDKVFHISAKTGYGVPQLQQYLLTMSKPKEWQHPPHVKSNLTPIEIYQQMLRQAIFNRSYKQLPHQIDIVCVSFTEKTNGKDQIIFDIFVATQNQQRMIIGTQGRNMHEIIQEVKLQYAKMYGREAEVIVSAKIRNRFKQKFRGREEIFTKDFNQQDLTRLKVLKQGIASKRQTGIFRKIPQ